MKTHGARETGSRGGDSEKAAARRSSSRRILLRVTVAGLALVFVILTGAALANAFSRESQTARSTVATLTATVTFASATSSPSSLPAAGTTSTPTPTPTATVSSTPTPTPSASSTSTPAPTSTPSATPTPTPSSTPVPPAPHLRVIAVVPHPGARTVSPASAITIRFSAPLALGTHLPTLTPAVPGSWRIVDSSALVFRPTGHLPVYTTVHVTVGAGTAGVRAADGGTIVAKYVASFSVGGPVSLLRAQQLLAELGYLPLRFQHYVREPANTDLISLQPLHIPLVWRYRHIPRLLAAQWKPGRDTVLVKGAVMTFEADHHLATDGVLGRQAWTTLLAATARHQLSRHTYNFVEVSMALPESLSLWQDGRIIYRTRVNTGIAAAPTARGMFPVYARFRSVTMSGRLPNGAQYDDPGVPYVAYFNGGDAVHGFLRPAYGYPQSLGCVELPYAAAAVVFRYDPIGTLVCVF